MILPKFFRIGVYGILYENNKILLTKENIKGQEVIKFPGGGLQFGEGTIDALKREFLEELNTPIYIIHHIYTTDFYVQSAFDKNYQVIAIYYMVKLMNKLPADNFVMNNIQFFQEDINKINKNMLTFDTDKMALEKFLNQIKNI